MALLISLLSSYFFLYGFLQVTDMGVCLPLQRMDPFVELFVVGVDVVHQGILVGLQFVLNILEERRAVARVADADGAL